MFEGGVFSSQLNYVRRGGVWSLFWDSSDFPWFQEKSLVTGFYLWNVYLSSPTQQRSAAAVLLQIHILSSLLRLTCKQSAVNLACLCSPPSWLSPVGKWNKNERRKLLLLSLFFTTVGWLSLLNLPTSGACFNIRHVAPASENWAPQPPVSKHLPTCPWDTSCPS